MSGVAALTAVTKTLSVATGFRGITVRAYGHLQDFSKANLSCPAPCAMIPVGPKVRHGRQSDILLLENLTENSTLTFYNLSGKLLMQKAIEEESTSVDVSGLPKGVYLLEVRNQEGERVFRKVMRE